MLQRDVVMREIEQAVRVLMHVLAQVMRLKSEERYQEALRSIREAFGDLGPAPRPVGELSPQALVDLCRSPGRFQVDLAVSMADLLCEEAELLLRTGSASAPASAARAHALYWAALDAEGAALPMDIGEKLTRMEEIVAGSRESHG